MNATTKLRGQAWLRGLGRAALGHPSVPYLGLLTVYTLITLAPLFHPGYFFSAHDGRHNVFYLQMFDASIRDGALWPRWAMHHIQGYGYPTFILQAPIGFYVGELFVLLGAGYTLAVKLTWAVGFLFSGWGMYVLVLEWLRRDRSANDAAPRFQPLYRWAALLAGVLYVVIPYHLVGIYVRAALNDTLLFAWFPWVFLTFDRLITYGMQAGWGRRLALATLTLGGALLTHTFALLSFAPLLVTFVIFRLVWLWRFPLVSRSGPEGAGGSPVGQAARAGLLAAGAGVAALLLIATFLLPLVVEGQHLEQNVYVEDTYNYRNHFVHVGHLFSSFWGFGYSHGAQSESDGMGFQIGLIPIGLALVGMALWGQGAEKRTVRRGLMAYLLGAGAALAAFITPPAAPLWDALPPLALIQFPWRLLSLTAFVFSALAGLVAANLLRWHAGTVPADGEGLPDQNEISAGAILLIGLTVFASFGYMGAHLEAVEPWREDGRAVFQFETQHPDMLAYTEWVDEPFRTSPMTADYERPDYSEAAARAGLLTRLAIVEGEGEILAHYSGGSSGGGIVRMDGPGTVRVHLLYFSGWQATVNGAPVEVRVSRPHGLLELDVGAGEQRIDVRMGTTPVRTLGTIISWVTLAALLAIWTVPGWRDRRRIRVESSAREADNVDA